MHSRVLLAMKGESGVLTSREEMDEKALCDFVDDLQISNGDHESSEFKKLAVCPVPANFYNWVHSSQGVICDARDVSFAPLADVGASDSNGGVGQM